MKHPSSPRRLFQLLILILAVACQGRGRVHEAPPASYPDGDPIEAPTAAPPAPPSEPSADDEADAEPPAPWASPSSPELEERSAAAEAKPDTGASLGRAQPTTQAPARQRDDYRSGPRSQRPIPEERPGLATHWGEARYSPARQVDFERDEARPSAVVELHYNDRAGARRMLPRGEWGRTEAWALGGLHISVVDNSGSALPALRSGSRVIGVGAPGERYALAIENDRCSF
jgi:hypothetical protein